MKVEIDTVAIAFVLFGDRNDHDLSRRQEQWPFSIEMLDQDSHEPLYGTEDSSMDHNRSREPRFNSLFFPFIVFIIPLIFFERICF
jgi:hypothetical protein